MLVGASVGMSMITRGEIFENITGGIVKGHGQLNRWMVVAGLLGSGAALRTLFTSAFVSVNAPTGGDAIER